MENQELENLKENCLERICFYSDNDPYVPQKEAENFAEYIKAQNVLIQDAGHFNEKYGYKEFKEVWSYI